MIFIYYIVKYNNKDKDYELINITFYIIYKIKLEKRRGKNRCFKQI